MIFAHCRVGKCCVVASSFLMYVLCTSFVEQINKESRMHLFDAEAGLPLFEKKLRY